MCCRLIGRLQAEAAALIESLVRLRLGSGAVIAVPIPPQHAAEGGAVQRAIHQALEDLQAQKITGNEVNSHLQQETHTFLSEFTPFLRNSHFLQGIHTF
jgi:pseudouridine-5'-phosphate glycosidase